MTDRIRVGRGDLTLYDTCPSGDSEMARLLRSSRLPHRYVSLSGGDPTLRYLQTDYPGADAINLLVRDLRPGAAERFYARQQRLRRSSR